MHVTELQATIPYISSISHLGDSTRITFYERLLVRSSARRGIKKSHCKSSGPHSHFLATAHLTVRRCRGAREQRGNPHLILATHIMKNSSAQPLSTLLKIPNKSVPHGSWTRWWDLGERRYGWVKNRSFLRGTDVKL